jgi:tetratricopeptide (TPR) repeat protein
MPAGQGTIIIVDDDRHHAADVEAFIRRLGYDTLAYEDAADGLRAIHDASPDLVILSDEATLGGNDTLLQTLRRTVQGRTLPIVLFGPRPESEQGGEADFYLRRPFQMAQLAAVIEALDGGDGPTRAAPGEPLDPAIIALFDDVPERGKLDEISFGSVFAKYWRAAACGVMALKAGTTLRRIDFSNGFAVASRSNLVTEHLLRFLLRLGFITPETYRKLLPEAQAQDWDPYETLVGTGSISEDTLREAQTKLVREILLQCFKWNVAAFRFSPKIVPAQADMPVTLNPFEVYMTWLRDPSTDQLLARKASRLTAMGLQATRMFQPNRHLIEPFLGQLKEPTADFDGSMTFGRILEQAIDDEEAKAVLVTLADLGAISPVRIQRGKRPVEEPSTAGGKKFARIRQMVSEDHARVARAQNAYAVLGLTDGSGAAEVVQRYQRFQRFYRPENFERIGDKELLDTVRELLVAFRDAATEILGKPPVELPAPVEPRPSKKKTSKSLSRDEQVLAEVFFDDGRTYLELDDPEEALQHFSRSLSLVPNDSRFLAYSGWASYHAANGDEAGATEAKQTLLSALKADARNDQALYFLGCIYEDAGRIERAIDCWKKALRFNSANRLAKSALRRVDA